MPSMFGYYLDVIAVLAEKDFKIRYRNSVLGFLWSLLNPLAYMVVLSLVFSFIFGVNIPGYASWLLVGLLVWRYFSVATRQALFSIVGNAPLVSKLYMPRYLIVLSNSVAALLGSALEFVALLPVLILLGVNFTATALLLPAALILECVLVFALSLSLSSLNLRYRDLNEIWDIALQLGFFLSPIVYEASLIPARYQFLYSLNPVTRLIDLTRAILLEHRLPSLFDYAVMGVSITILLVVGFAIFRHLEERFAEEL